ncbi:MAG: hypothetical protein LC715_03000, partial [Gammaproteobacteria bacterium]|nr:hypothetical protein [Gammaproteobacteria bacterium]
LLPARGEKESTGAASATFCPRGQKENTGTARAKQGAVASTPGDERMAHKVIFNLPRRELGREDIEFVVEQDGKRFGTLLVSKGAIEWRPTNKVYRRKLSWTRFDQLMREAGRPV